MSEQQYQGGSLLHSSFSRPVPRWFSYRVSGARGVPLSMLVGEERICVTKGVPTSCLRLYFSSDPPVAQP